MFHPDLHKRNIFVSEDDPTALTGFIDWQSTSIEPAFYYADEEPDFAKVPVSGNSEPTEETFCNQAFEAGLGLLAPRLAAARAIDENLLRPFRYCHRTWRDGLIPLSQALIQLREHRQAIGYQKDCFMPHLDWESNPVYQEQLDIYDKMLALRQDIIETLGVEQDGWVPLDRWEEVNAAHRQIYGAIVGAMENEKDREDMRLMWPFDDVDSCDT